MRRSRDRRIHAGSSQGARAHPLPRPDAEAQSSLGSGLNLPPIRRRLLAGGSWAFFGKAVNVAGAVAISALLARLLSPENMGAYFLAFSVVTGMALAARMGLDNSVVKIVAESLGLQEYTRARQVLKPLFMLAALSTLVIASVVWLFAGRWLAESVFGSPAMAGATGLIALWIVALAFQQLLAETFRGFHNIRLATLIGGSVTTLLSALAYASVWFAEGQANLATAVALRVTATGITVAAAAWLLLRTVRPLQGGDPSPVPARAILHESWPLLISNVTYYVLTHADLWILGAY
jgi:O-antigen/teichoic acid export membrane protein